MSQKRMLTGLVAILVLATIVFLYVDLDSARASLRDEQAAHHATTESLQSTQAALDETRSSLDDLVQALDPLQQDALDLRRINATLRSDNEALVGYLNTSLLESAGLADDLDAATLAHDGVRGELIAAETQVTTLTAEKGVIESQLGEMTRWFETRNDDYNTLSERHERLQQTAATLAELEARIGELHTEIAELEEQRRPLFLASQRIHNLSFLCTGSMEPKLTCLDSATWMRDFSPEEIVVGTIINFDNTACWEDSTGGSTAHRVVDVQVIDGVHHYWPKGDAHANADGCWVPHIAVDGYMIEIYKNTVTANAELRDNVNSAKAAYNTAWEAYLDAIEANCGHREPQRCSVSLVTELGRHAQSLWLIAEEASNHYSCWYANAAASRYPGHIPYTC